MDYRLL
jgi:integrase